MSGAASQWFQRFWHYFCSISFTIQHTFGLGFPGFGIQKRKQIELWKNVWLDVVITCTPMLPFSADMKTSGLLKLIHELPLVIACECSRFGTPPSPDVILEMYFCCHRGTVGEVCGLGFVFSFQIKQTHPSEWECLASSWVFRPNKIPLSKAHTGSFLWQWCLGGGVCLKQDFR